jgi:hypothetical protein
MRLLFIRIHLQYLLILLYFRQLRDCVRDSRWFGFKQREQNIDWPTTHHILPFKKRMIKCHKVRPVSTFQDTRCETNDARAFRKLPT